MEQNLSIVAAVAATFFLAGIVKGVTGMGLPTVAMGILAWVVSPLTAAALLLVPSFVTNAWQLLSGPSFGSLLLRFWPMMLTVAIGTIAGSAMLTSGDTNMTTAALGIILVVYASCTLVARPLRVPLRWERTLAPMVGAATGLITGGTGVFVVPVVPYLQSLGLSNEELVQALGLSFTVSTIALAIGLGWYGRAFGAIWLASGLSVIPALIGMATGQLIRKRISPSAFRRVFLLGLFCLGLSMASGALF
jgi:uncharacterized protein